MDARPSMASAIAAFGLPVLMVRPEVGAVPVSTSGIWVAPKVESMPLGTDMQRFAPRRVLAIPRNDGVPIPIRETVFLAAEYLGGPEINWRMDELEEPLEVDCYRVIVTQVRTAS